MAKQPPNPTKRCSGCGEDKPLEAFYKDVYKSSKLTSRCKECLNDRDWRPTILKSKYGMTPDDWDEMLAEQGGGCAICGTTEPGGRWNTFYVDHDHATDEVRGLLCNNHNVGLGMFNDDPDLLQKAIDYLRRHEERREAA